jgi:hypothetical protein
LDELEIFYDLPSPHSPPNSLETFHSRETSIKHERNREQTEQK